MEVVHSRVEKLERAGEYDAVLSRAFASVDGIMNLTEHLLQAEGVLIAMKGQSPEAELKNIQRSYTVNSIVLPGVEAERCVLRINKI